MGGISKQGSVWVPKLDVTDAYHRGTLCLSQVRAFIYVIPSAANKDFKIICIHLVLLIVWVDPPKCF